MTLLTKTFERLGGFLAAEALGLKVAESRSLLVALIVILAFSLKYASCIGRLTTWLMECRHGNTPPDSAASVRLQFSEVMRPSSAWEEELSRKDVDPIVALYEKAKTPPATPPMHSSSLWRASDCPEMSDNCSSSGDSIENCSDPFDCLSGLDDLWSSAGDFLAGPEAAVTADANSVLETALASGDAKLADAALAAGVRLCSSTWLTKACSQIQAAGIPLMHERALDLIRVYGHERRADLAVDLWESQCAELGLDPADGEHSDPPPAAELYGAALEACARAGDFETAARAASSTDWRVPPCRHGQSAFLALARWFARRQDVEQALVCYTAVRDVTGSADLATHRAILYASVRSADMAKADALFQDLISSGITPDGASFSAMICGHCSATNVERAMHYFDLLRGGGIIPTGRLFDAILDGCASMNMPGLMEQVLADMEASGVRPSTTTLSILMRIHGMNRDTEQVLAVFDELPRKHGLKLDGHAYGTLISVCLKNDAYGMAWNAFERMSAADCMAHARIYEALVLACLRQGHLDNAVQVVYKALGMSNPDTEESTMTTLRLRLQPKIIEDVLTLVGRRRQAARLGVPMVEHLIAFGVDISETLVESVLRSANAETELPCSQLHHRRVQRSEWRNFREIEVTQ